MALFDLLRGKKRPPGPSVELPRVLERMNAVLPIVGGSLPQELLIFARLADACRDLKLEPVLPERMDDWCEDLGDEGLQRLRLLLAPLDEPAVLRALENAGTAEELVQRGFVEVARRTPLLDIELLRQSPLRVEELARTWLAALHLGIVSETPEQSKLRLDRLDYTKLLAEAERAKTAAEAKMAKLKKVQDEAEQKRSRGKW